ncbi:hypothetical protein [Butyrivibrio fibrisolvens]|uniref:hypothetical protein n=1 Tax=Butyrivibrio fibrisolvens TaxID=831 RepID=UPI000426ED0B|nr:hypothetical protein [Butyrivibrio fibrisolvens]
MYKEGRKLAESILSVRVEVDGDYGDYMSAEFDISVLYDNDLLKVSRETLRTRVSLNREDKEKLFKKIDKWIQLRVDAIMNANCRNYYHECAMYIAAFGEAQESNGVTFAKQQILQKYKNLYSRRRVYIDELKGVGLRK